MAIPVIAAVLLVFAKSDAQTVKTLYFKPIQETPVALAITPTIENLRAKLIKDLEKEIQFINQQIPNVFLRLFSSSKNRQRYQNLAREKLILENALRGEREAAERREKFLSQLALPPKTDVTDVAQFERELKRGLNAIIQLFLK